MDERSRFHREVTMFKLAGGPF